MQEQTKVDLSSDEISSLEQAYKDSNDLESAKQLIQYYRGQNDLRAAVIAASIGLERLRFLFPERELAFYKKSKPYSVSHPAEHALYGDSTTEVKVAAVELKTPVTHQRNAVYNFLPLTSVTRNQLIIFNLFHDVDFYQGHVNLILDGYYLSRHRFDTQPQRLHIAKSSSVVTELEVVMEEAMKWDLNIDKLDRVLAFASKVAAAKIARHDAVEILRLQSKTIDRGDEWIAEFCGEAMQGLAKDRGDERIAEFFCEAMQRLAKDRGDEWIAEFCGEAMQGLANLTATRRAAKEAKNKATISRCDELMNDLKGQWVSIAERSNTEESMAKFYEWISGGRLSMAQISMYRNHFSQRVERVRDEKSREILIQAIATLNDDAYLMQYLFLKFKINIDSVALHYEGLKRFDEANIIRQFADRALMIVYSRQPVEEKLSALNTHIKTYQEGEFRRYSMTVRATISRFQQELTDLTAHLSRPVESSKERKQATRSPFRRASVAASSGSSASSSSSSNSDEEYGRYFQSASSSSASLSASSSCDSSPRSESPEPISPRK